MQQEEAGGDEAGEDEAGEADSSSITATTNSTSLTFATHLVFCLFYLLWAFGFMEVAPIMCRRLLSSPPGRRRRICFVIYGIANV